MLNIKLVKELTNRILDLLFPTKCISCGSAIIDDLGLCALCFKHIEFYSSPKCHRCGEIYEYNTHGNCHYCNHFSLTNTFNIFHYGDNIRELIHKFKYEDHHRIGKFFAKLISYQFKDMIKSHDILIPIPMHKKKLKMRKYCHTAILAKHIARYTNSNFNLSILNKVIDNKSQYSLSYQERLTNVKDCFIVNSKLLHLIKDKKILLIDDVMTTGATINEAAKLLLTHGAKEVNCCLIARNNLKSDLFNILKYDI